MGLGAGIVQWNTDVYVLIHQEERSTQGEDASPAVMPGNSTCVAQHGQYCQFVVALSQVLGSSRS